MRERRCGSRARRATCPLCRASSTRSSSAVRFRSCPSRCRWPRRIVRASRTRRRCAPFSGRRAPCQKKPAGDTTRASRHVPSVAARGGGEGALDVIADERHHQPLVAVEADGAPGVKVIEQHVTFGQRVMVGGDGRGRKSRGSDRRCPWPHRRRPGRRCGFSLMMKNTCRMPSESSRAGPPAGSKRGVLAALHLARSGRDLGIFGDAGCAPAEPSYWRELNSPLWSDVFPRPLM